MDSSESTILRPRVRIQSLFDLVSNYMLNLSPYCEMLGALPGLIYILPIEVSSWFDHHHLLQVAVL